MSFATGAAWGLMRTPARDSIVTGPGRSGRQECLLAEFQLPVHNPDQSAQIQRDRDHPPLSSP
jgi:hypothetical protein